jgi:hypothetical protein
MIPPPIPPPIAPLSSPVYAIAVAIRLGLGCKAAITSMQYKNDLLFATALLIL